MLATIIGTSGSTPAPAESRMMIYCGENVQPIGTIGGGCLDQGVISTVKEFLPDEHARIMAFNLNDDVGDTGLCCGGNLDVLLERLCSAKLSVYQRIVDTLQRGQDLILLTVVSSARDTKKTVFDLDGNILEGDNVAEGTLEIARRWIPKVRMTNSGKHLRAESDEIVIEFIAADPPLIVFGGGHVGRVVSGCAALVGFRVTVVDDRRAFANKERFPEAERTLCESFDKVFQRLQITPSTYVVIATRGHRHDETVLQRILQYETKYVGMIGSRRKVIISLDHLGGVGVSEERLSNIHAPIGVNIGAQTAEEIGISIVAELIAVRRGCCHLGENDGKRSVLNRQQIAQ